MSGLVAPAIGLAIIVGLLLLRRRIGQLRTAALLVTLGTVGLLEHPGFSAINALQVPSLADAAFIPAHAKLHFFMGAIYALIGLSLILFIAWGGLARGRRSAWYALLGALIVGGVSELAAGALIFQHGAPIYGLFGITVRGFNWGFLYLYLVAWPCALAVSFRPVFRVARAGTRAVEGVGHSLSDDGTV